jgi:hypothetical protein
MAFPLKREAEATMEDLVRLVGESLARNGFETSLDHRRLQWSNWHACESILSLAPLPCKPGLVALGEEVAAPGGVSDKRMLAVFEITDVDDLHTALGGIFLRRLRERCFVRYTVIEDAAQRRASHAALSQWLASEN